MEDEVKKIVDKVLALRDDIYSYIVDTEHWLFYWIKNKEVQDFVRKYPEDFENMIHMSIVSVDSHPQVRITFDEHPSNIDYIERYVVLETFRVSVKARWEEWNGNVKEMQIAKKTKELSYYKRKVSETENELDALKYELDLENHTFTRL